MSIQEIETLIERYHAKAEKAYGKRFTHLCALILALQTRHKTLAAQ